MSNPLPSDSAVPIQQSPEQAAKFQEIKTLANVAIYLRDRITATQDAYEPMDKAMQEMGKIRIDTLASFLAYILRLIRTAASKYEPKSDLAVLQLDKI